MAEPTAAPVRPAQAVPVVPTDTVAASAELADHHFLRATFDISGFRSAVNNFTIAAGQCALEERETNLVTAAAAAAAGWDMLRACVYKPRTDRPDQELGRPRLELISELRAKAGMPVLCEVLDPRGREPRLGRGRAWRRNRQRA